MNRPKHNCHQTEHRKGVKPNLVRKYSNAQEPHKELTVTVEISYSYFERSHPIVH